MSEKKDQEILIGIKAIQLVLGGVSEDTILKWKREYPSMPMRKIKGQWTTTREEMVRWWGFFVTDKLELYKSSNPNSNGLLP